MYPIVTQIIFIISMLMFVCAALQLIIRDKSKISNLMSLLYFILGYFWLHFWMYRTGKLFKTQWLYRSDIVATYLIGPVVYFYINGLAGKANKTSGINLLKFVPAVISFLLLIIFQSDQNIPGEIIQTQYFSQNRMILILEFLSEISVLVYIFLSLKIFRDLVKKGYIQSRWVLFGFIVVFSAAILSFIPLFLGHFLNKDILLGIGVIAIGLDCVFYFFMSYRYPEYTQRAIKPPQIPRDPDFLTDNFDSAEILNKLNELMESEKMYRDTEISLQKLSNRLGIKSYQLSLILNIRMKANFRTFINYYRLQEAKELLVLNPDKQIIEIAYFVGFNSKSTFNTIFARETGLTPTKFRNNHNK